MTYLGERGDPRHEFIALRDQCVDLDEQNQLGTSPLSLLTAGPLFEKLTMVVVR